MYSPASHHLKVPKDPAHNLVWRLRVLRRARTDRAFRAALMDRCAADFFFWVNGFVVQFNPNSIGDGSTETGPFICWDFQEVAVREILRCIEQRDDLAIEKSREMGASWLCLLVMAWLYLFHAHKKFLLISRSEEAVYKPGDDDALFSKLEWIFAHLPAWMTSGRIGKRKRVYNNPLLRSSITGQATTDKAGVGGRCTAMFLDEFSRVSRGFAVLDATAGTTACRIFNSTHQGTDTAFFDRSNSQYVRKLQIHWSQHPDKRKGSYRFDPITNQIEVIDKTYQYPADYNFVMDGSPTGGPFPGLRSPWYDKECHRLGSTSGVARELDINPAGSVSQFYDSIRVRDLIQTECCEPRWRGDILFEKDTGKFKGLVQRDDGPLALWIMPTIDGVVPIDEYTMGSDTAYGVGVTPSCTAIGSVRRQEKVAEYANARIEVWDFAALNVALAWLFKDGSGRGALFCWEDNGPGHRMGQRVLELGYRNVWFRRDTASLSPTISNVAGWLNTPTTRLELLKDHQEAIFTRRLIDRSEICLKESLDFHHWNNTVRHSRESPQMIAVDPSGAGQNHGDRVMATALMWKMMKLKGLNLPKVAYEPPPAPIGSLAWRALLHEDAERREEAWS